MYNVKNLNAFHLRLEQDKNVFLSLLINIVFIVLASATKQEKEIKDIQMEKKKINKAISIH